MRVDHFFRGLMREAISSGSGRWACPRSGFWFSPGFESKSGGKPTFRPERLKVCSDPRVDYRYMNSPTNIPLDSDERDRRVFDFKNDSSKSGGD